MKFFIWLLRLETKTAEDQCTGRFYDSGQGYSRCFFRKGHWGLCKSFYGDRWKGTK